MSVYRVKKDRNFTAMSNHHLQNRGLSLRAKGLLSLMLSLPDDWQYSLKGLAAISQEEFDGITGYAYIRDDGVMVVPITELKP